MNPRDALNPLNVVLVLMSVAATVAGFVLIPADAMLPVHWGITGEADAHLPRNGALLMQPAISIVVIGLLIVLPAVLGTGAHGARHALRVVVPTLLGLFLAIQVAIVMIGSGMAVDMVRLIVLGLGVMLAVLGNVLPKTQPNLYAGVRFPWTLRDPANWQATNRLGGLLMVLGGLLMAVAALLTGNATALLAVTATGVVLPIIITTIYSYRLAHRN